MDFAADAVLNVIAPPTRSAPPRADAPDPTEPSFDEHLDAVVSEDTPRDDTAAPTDRPKADVSASDEKVAATPAPNTEPAAPPLIVQIVATPIAPTPENTAAATTADGKTLAAAPDMPLTPDAAPAPCATPNLSPNAAPTAPATSAAPESANAQHKTAPIVAPTPAPVVADASAPVAPVANAAAPVAAPTQAPTPTAPSAEAAPAAPIAVALAVPITRETTTRTAKTDQAQGDAKTAQPAHNARAAVVAPAATPKSTAKSSPVSGAVKENIPSAMASVPDAPAPAPQNLPAVAQNAAQTQHAVLDQSAVRAAPATAQVAREIIRRFDGENMRFELRLDPAELGRVDIRLEVSRDHRVTAVVAADNPQALAELSRHARELEQMLQSSGLELTENGLSFDLRQGNEGAEDAHASNGARGAAEGEDPLQVEQQSLRARPLGFESWRGARIDVMV